MRERMCQLVSEKDRGFSRAVLVEILESFDRFTAHELGIDEPDRRGLAGSVQRWREALTRPATRVDSSIRPGTRPLALTNPETSTRHPSTSRTSRRLATTHTPRCQLGARCAGGCGVVRYVCSVPLCIGSVARAIEG